MKRTTAILPRHKAFLTLCLFLSTFVGILSEGMAVSLINNTGATVQAGSIVSVDPKSKGSFVYASAGASDIIGVLASDTPKYAKGDILTDGVAGVLITERVTRGSTIRSWKVTDRISRGTGKTAKATDVPYFLIGTALEEGVGLIRCQLSLRYVPLVSTDAYATLNSPTFTGTVVLPGTTSIGDVSSTEISYLNNVTSAIQTQLNAKLETIPIATVATLGGIIVGANLTVDVNGVLNGDGGAGATNWGLIGGTLTDQIDLGIALGLKANLAGPTFTGTVTLPTTTSIGDVSATEIGYVNGVTSAIQTQINAKAPIASPTFTGCILNEYSAGSPYGFYTSKLNNHLTQNAYYDGAWKSYGADADYGGAVLFQTSGGADGAGSALKILVDLDISAADEALSFTTLFDMKMDGKTGFGFTSPLSRVCVNGGLHVGGESDAGNDNLLVDGTCEITGASLFTGLVKTVGGVHVGGASDPGADNLLVDGDTKSTTFTIGSFVFAVSGSDLQLSYSGTPIVTISSAGYISAKDEVEPFAF